MPKHSFFKYKSEQFSFCICSSKQFLLIKCIVYSSLSSNVEVNSFIHISNATVNNSHSPNVTTVFILRDITVPCYLPGSLSLYFLKNTSVYNSWLAPRARQVSFATK